MDAGTDTDVTVNVQRMVDGPGDYTITGRSYEVGFPWHRCRESPATTGPARRVTIKVADSVQDGYYPLVLTTSVGKGDRTFTLLVATGEDGG